MRIMGIMACLFIGCGSSSNPAPDAAPAPTTVFLNFEGGAMHAGPDDSATNTSALLTADMTLVPYLDGDPNRQTAIDAIMTRTQTLLAPYAIDFTTTRPASGPFMMVVFTGSASMYGFPDQTTGLAAGGCTLNKNAVVLEFVSTLPFDNADYRAGLTVDMLGNDAVIPDSKIVNDCMCGEYAACRNYYGMTCTIGGPNTYVDEGNVDAHCPGIGATMDEGALFAQQFGTRNR